VPIAPPPAPSSPASSIYSVQRIIAEKVVLRVGLDGQIDARALAARGIRIADADRRDPRLVGRAREQQRHARTVVETFVTRYPGFIVQTGDVCSLSTNAKPDLRTFFEDHDDPWMQVMLRRVLDRREAAANVARVPDQDVPPSAVAASAEAPPPSMTTLVRDPALIAAARARQREREQQAQATPPRGTAGQQGIAAAQGEKEHQADPVPPPTPAPRRPPPSWDGGFGR
jgi:hypothetical protein